LAGVALVLLGTAYASLAAALTCLIALFLPTSFRWVIASALIALICGVPGAILAYVAIKRLRLLPLIPKKTLDVLKDDRNWLENGGKAA
jgi:MFS family permease